MSISPETAAAAIRSAAMHPGHPNRNDAAEDALHIATMNELAEVVEYVIGETDIPARVEKPELQIDSQVVAAYLPDVLRLVADRLDGERAKRLAKVEPVRVSGYGLPEICR